MNETTLPILDTIRLAWSKISGTKGSFWAALLILFGISFTLCMAALFFQHIGLGIFAKLFPLIDSIVKMIIGWSLLYMGIQRALDLPVQYKQMWHCTDLNLFLKLFILSVLYVLILLTPFLLLLLLFISPSLLIICYIAIAVAYIYIAARLYIAVNILIMKNCGPLQALKWSFCATKNHAWSLCGLIILNFLIIAVSAIPLGIGLIWTIPYLFIFHGVIYQKLFDARPEVMATK